MNILILEDNEDRRNEMARLIAKTWSEDEVSFSVCVPSFADVLKNADWDSVRFIALDHDLEMLPGDSQRMIDPGDGVQAAELVAAISTRCPVMVHTTNTLGGDRMMEVLEGAGWRTTRVVPYGGEEWIAEVWIPALLEILSAHHA